MMIDETLTPTDEAQQPISEESAVSDAQVEAEKPTDAPVAETKAPVAPKVEAAPVLSQADDMALFEAAMNEMEADSSGVSEGGFKKLSRGDRVEATVIQVDKDRLFVDLGTKSEGIIPIGELSDSHIESVKDLYSIGDRIQVVVIKPEGGDGNAIVSKKRADFEEAWDRIEDALKTGETLAAQVVDRVKGGLSVDVGVRGFVPATHVGSGKLRNIEKYVGQAINLKVIEIDRERRKVVLSNRMAEEEQRGHAKEEIFKSVAPGDRLSGTVRRLTDYGAFIDLGGVDGLLHISEMSWMRINHPKEMFKEGQKIEVMVLRLDAANGKISLGHRQVLPDPWNLIKQNYTINQKMNVVIGRLVQSGAFIKLAEGAEAFLPLSEMSFRRVKRPEDLVAEGQEVEVQIIDLRTEERRMVLSMKATGSLPAPTGGSYESSSEMESDGRGGQRKKAGKKGGRGRGRDDDDFEDSLGSRRAFGTSTGSGVTIGERLGLLKGLVNRDEATEASDEEE